MQKTFVVDFWPGSKYASEIGRNLLLHWLYLPSNNEHIACSYHSVFWCFALVTERKKHRRWWITFLTISQNSQDSTSAGVSTYQFNSQSMGKISKFHRKPPVLEHGTVRSYVLIKLQQIRSVTLLNLDSNTDVFLWNLWNFSEHLFWRISANKCFYKWKTARNSRFFG